MLKKLALGLVALIVVVGIGLTYLWSNLDGLISKAVEKYGSAATQTDVRLEHVKLSVSTGEGSLSGFSVGNPSGYTAKQALYLGSIAIAVDAKSITGNGPIVIHNIAITKPQVTFEVDASGGNNLKTIANNAQAYAGSSDKAAKAKAAAPSKSESDNKPSRKIVIEDLTITDGQISIATPLLKGQQLNAPLPTIHLTNIGKTSGGESPADLAKLLLTTITQSASEAATLDITKQLGNITSGLTSGLTNGLKGNAAGQLKGLLGN